MKTKKLTRWFSGDVKPVRIGAYETSPYPENSLPKIFQNWNGEWWGTVHYSPEDAEFDARNRSSYQSLYWRGLASDPNA